MTSLLAVDLGVRAGLALYGRDGRLKWYRSRNFGTIQRLRRGVSAVLDGISDIDRLVLEGGWRTGRDMGTGGDKARAPCYQD